MCRQCLGLALALRSAELAAGKYRMARLASSCIIGMLTLYGKPHPLLATPMFPYMQGGLGLALALAFVALNIATGNARAAALAIFCVVGTFSSAAGIGGAMMYWHLEVAEVVAMLLILACAFHASEPVRTGRYWAGLGLPYPF